MLRFVRIWPEHLSVRNLPSHPFVKVTKIPRITTKTCILRVFANDFYAGKYTNAFELQGMCLHETRTLICKFQCISMTMLSFPLINDSCYSAEDFSLYKPIRTQNTSHVAYAFKILQSASAQPNLR